MMLTPVICMQAVAMSAASPGGSWETIPTGGKGRRSSTSGPRNALPAAESAVPTHAQRGTVAAEAALKRAAPASAAQHVQQHRAAVPAQHQQPEAASPGHQPRQHLRAVPVTTAPYARVRSSLRMLRLFFSHILSILSWPITFHCLRPSCCIGFSRVLLLMITCSTCK